MEFRFAAATVEAALSRKGSKGLWWRMELLWWLLRTTLLEKGASGNAEAAAEVAVVEAEVDEVEATKREGCMLSAWWSAGVNGGVGGGLLVGGAVEDVPSADE